MQLHRIIPKALLAAVGGRKLRLQGGGVAKKSFLHTGDLAMGLQLICEKGIIGGTYNVGPLNSISILQVVQICANVAGVSFDDFVELVPARIGEDSEYWLNSGKTISLGWKQTVTLTQGIENMFSWVRRYKEELLKLPDTYRVLP